MSSNSASYEVVSSATVHGTAGGSSATVHGTAAGQTFALTVAGGCVAAGAKLSVTATQIGSPKKYRADRYSFFIDQGIVSYRFIVERGRRRRVVSYTANLVTRSPGGQAISVAGLTSGVHKLTLVITLRPTAQSKHGDKAATKTLRLISRFVVC